MNIKNNNINFKLSLQQTRKKIILFHDHNNIKEFEGVRECTVRFSEDKLEILNFGISFLVSIGERNYILYSFSMLLL